MSHTDDALVEFLAHARCRMREQYLPKLEACLDVLNAWRLWTPDHKRPSIGAVIVHLSEHVRRDAAWMSGGERASGAPALEEYFPNLGEDPAILLERCRAAFVRWDVAVASALRHLRLHGTLPDTGPGVGAIFHLVEHVSYHLGQVVARTTAVTGVDFAFVQRGLSEHALTQAVDDSLCDTRQPTLVLPFANGPEWEE